MTVAFLVIACIYVGVYVINSLDAIVCRNVRFRGVRRRRDLDWEPLAAGLVIVAACATLVGLIFGVIAVIEAIF